MIAKEMSDYFGSLLKIIFFRSEEVDSADFTLSKTLNLFENLIV